MRKLLFVAIACLIACGIAVADAAGGNAFTIEDLLRLQRISDPQISPDGRYVVFTVQQIDLDANRGRTDLWLLDLTRSSAEPRRLVATDADEWNGRWMPDSKGLYFLSTRSGSSQVWRLRLAAGLEDNEAAQVTHLPLDVDSLKVSPRGDRLLVSVEVFPDCADLTCTASRLQVRAQAKGSGRAYDRLFIRHWDRWADDRQSHLFSVALTPAGQAAAAVDLSRKLDADVPSKPRGSDEEFDFSPDGTRVAFTARIKGRDEAWSTNFDIYETAADGSVDPVNLTAGNPAWDTQPVYSADGRWLAWRAMDKPGNEADRFHLVLKDRSSGSVRRLTDAWDRSITRFAFADDRRIIATADHLGQYPLWSIDLRSGAPTAIQATGQVTDFSVAKQSVVFGLAALDAPVDLYRIETGARAGDKQAQRLTRLNSTLLDARELAKFEQFSFAGWNGETVRGYVMQPAGFETGRKYPVAFIVHGGPQLSYANQWSYRWNPQVYAGAGYAVVFIDFHGSTGYGQAFTDSITGDWGGKPLEDLRKGLAAAQQKYPWLDATRACAVGSSYSGYMMNWIEGSWSDGFRCLVNQSGVFDVRGMYYQTDEMWLDEWEQGGPQFERPASYDKHNPLTQVTSWRTPMLIGHGQIDFNVPYIQGVSAFTALQRRGIESRLVIFPDEGHFILKPQNSLQWHREILAWLDRWLKDVER